MSAADAVDPPCREQTHLNRMTVVCSGELGRIRERAGHDGREHSQHTLARAPGRPLAAASGAEYDREDDDGGNDYEQVDHGLRRSLTCSCMIPVCVTAYDLPCR